MVKNHVVNSNKERFPKHTAVWKCKLQNKMYSVIPEVIRNPPDKIIYSVYSYVEECLEKSYIEVSLECLC